MSGYSTHWLNGRWRDGLIVLSGCSHTYNKPPQDMSKDGLVPFCIVWWSFSSSRVDPSALARIEMLLSHSWLVIAHTDWTKGAMMVWQCYQVVPILLASLHKIWVRMVWLASASNDHSTPNDDHSTLARAEMLSNFWVVIAFTDWNHRCREGLTVFMRWYHAHNKPP